MLLKSCHWMDLEEYFLRDTLPTKIKLNECGILNLDSSPGDGTHCVMWFKKGKDKFYFDSYGFEKWCQTVVEADDCSSLKF